MQLPSDWVEFLNVLDNQHAFAAEGTSFMKALTFVCEDKPSDHDQEAAERQLTFDMSSAQHQRRALGQAFLTSYLPCRAPRHHFPLYRTLSPYSKVVQAPSAGRQLLFLLLEVLAYPLPKPRAVESL